jgi:hypothetical protein
LASREDVEGASTHGAATTEPLSVVLVLAVQVSTLGAAVWATSLGAAHLCTAGKRLLGDEALDARRMLHGWWLQNG